jgi:ribosome modulation factor
MTVMLNLPPAPVGQQVPPARAAARHRGALRVTRGALLLTTGTASRRDQPQETGVLSQDACSWDEGYAAGLSGMRSSLCPYPAGTTESWSWVSGYIEGKAVRLSRVKTATIKLDGIGEY